MDLDKVVRQVLAEFLDRLAYGINPSGSMEESRPAVFLDVENFLTREGVLLMLGGKTDPLFLLQEALDRPSEAAEKLLLVDRFH